MANLAARRRRCLNPALHHINIEGRRKDSDDSFDRCVSVGWVAGWRMVQRAPGSVLLALSLAVPPSQWVGPVRTRHAPEWPDRAPTSQFCCGKCIFIIIVGDIILFQYDPIFQYAQDIKYLHYEYVMNKNTPTPLVFQSYGPSSSRGLRRTKSCAPNRSF